MSCAEKNTLVREGTSQLNRVLAALSTSYARVDEREAADLILFARRYAAYLTYYDAGNEPAGNWEPFMKMDISVTLATLMKINVQALSDYRKLLYKRVRLSANDAESKKQFGFLFDLIISLASLVDEQYRLLPTGMEYRSLIKNLILTKMKPAFILLTGLLDAFRDKGWIDNSLTTLDPDAPLAVISASSFHQEDWADKEEWGLPGPPDAVDSITLPDEPAARENIIVLINHAIFNSQIDALLKGTAEIVTHASRLFESTLESFPSHAPHYALFLSFIKLFRQAQDHLNTYTQRHLDFYYKEVLLLKNKDPEPDSAHLVFELQKPVQQHLLKKDTLFKGVKDNTGKETSYKLPADLVLNKAKVVALRSLQLLKEEGRLLASPLAASADGRGAKLTSADKSWHTFGDPRKASNAATGFAIASHILFLNEGERTIILSIHFAENIKVIRSAGVNMNCFTAELSGAKGWHTPGKMACVFSSDDTLEITITLAPDEPAIIPFSPKIHEEEFATELPLLKIFLNQDIANGPSYASLAGKRLASVDISVKVKGVKNLVVSHDTGSIDTSKPFKPFGDFPKLGAGWYIGSKEIFQKPLTKISLYPEEIRFIPILSQVNFLSAGAWKKGGTLTAGVVGSITAAPAAIDFNPNESLTATTQNGFMQLVLNNGSYSLQQHLNRVSASLTNTKLTWNDDLPGYNVSIPATPVPLEIVLSHLVIDYDAEQTISFAATTIKTNELLTYGWRLGIEKFKPAASETHPAAFYHLTPFGYEPKAGKTTLLPVISNEGELFIGLENAMEDSVVTILFQVAEGSSNPLKPVQPVSWHYLGKNNTWQPFGAQAVIDATVHFTRSGIVSLSLPASLITQHSILDKGLCWIKASVSQNPDAVCQLISVNAQAAKVTLVQDEKKKIEFRQIVPAGAISKLLVGDPAIKTILQPFDSAGGRIRETDEHFYTRVSERLRHKQRAITIWDYEHILLEQFPELSKLRCLNHTGFYDTPGGRVICENYAGHVTIIPVPDLKNNTHVNPLRPYTPVGLLDAIETYLKTLISPFVKLHVVNPQLEEVRLYFKVKFHEHLDNSFYRQMLNKEIEQFLSPWAYDPGQEITFGGKVIKSALLNFVEERGYVDYVSCFKMDHITREGNRIIATNPDIEEAQGSTARSLLVSYYNEEEPDETKKRHVIEPLISCDC